MILFMSIAELGCITIAEMSLGVKRQRLDIPFNQFIYPALCDFAGSLIFMFGLINMNAYTYIMITAISIPLTALCIQSNLLRTGKTLDQM